MFEMLQTNLANLHAFWHAMAAKNNEAEIYLHANWPNKVWHSDFITLDINKWYGRVHVTLEEPKPQNKIKIKTQVTAMYLKLKNINGQEHEQVSLVKDLNELEEWCTACGYAFGYEIDKQALIPLLDNKNATIFAFRVNGKVAGTAILYQSKNNMGIHQVGVLPSFQGHGIGKALMLHLVAKAKNKACSTITLQASQNGMPMYINMGFTPLKKLYHLERITSD